MIYLLPWKDQPTTKNSLYASFAKLKKIFIFYENNYKFWRHMQSNGIYAFHTGIDSKKNPQISSTEHLWFLQGFAISNIFVAVSPSKTWRKSQNWIPFPFFARNKKWNGIPEEWLIFGEKINNSIVGEMGLFLKSWLALRTICGMKQRLCFSCPLSWQPFAQRKGGLSRKLILF